MNQPCRIRLAFFDIDGVLTDGTKLYHEDGTVSKRFHDRDSFGLRLLTEHGVDVILMSADERVNRTWAERQNLPFLCTEDKAEMVRAVLAQRGCNAREAAFVGDELRDLEAMKLVHHSIAPANAASEVRDAAQHRLTKVGGHGAAREAVELILKFNSGERPCEARWYSRLASERASVQ